MQALHILPHDTPQQREWRLWLIRPEWWLHISSINDIANLSYTTIEEFIRIHSKLTKFQKEHIQQNIRGVKSWGNTMKPLNHKHFSNTQQLKKM